MMSLKRTMTQKPFVNGMWPASSHKERFMTFKESDSTQSEKYSLNSGCPRPYSISGNGTLEFPMQTPHDQILTPFHQKLLKRFAASSMGRHFFLTGGTALAAFYLHHRLSDDLDLFTEAPDTVPLVLPVIQDMARDLK